MIRKIFSKKVILIVLAVLVILTILGGDKEQKPNIDLGNNSYEPSGDRNFYMGVSTWPPAATAEGINEMKKFIKDYSDITLLFLDTGVPWVEAGNNGALPSGPANRFKNEKNYIPSGNKVFLELSPIVLGTGNLANYWSQNESSSEPLPSPWNGYDLDDEEVKNAYLNYSKKAIEAVNPDYFALGVEVNEIIKNDKSEWPKYKELHSFVYSELKKEYPNLKIFATFVLMDPIVPAEDMEWLKNNNDILSLSTYPHVHGRAVNSSYFDTALAVGLPIGISETGLPSREFTSSGTTFKYTENDQAQFIEFLLNEAQENDFEFVINFANLDYDRLLEIFPNGKIKELAKLWAYTGFVTSDDKEKEALDVWEKFLNLSKN